MAAYWLTEYDKIRRLGKGVFGQAYLCRARDGSLVTVKYPSKESGALDSLIREEAAGDKLTGVNSENFSCPIKVIRAGGKIKAVVTRFAKGRDLQYLYDKALKGNWFNINELDDIMTDMLRTVLLLHNNNVVHRDIKPANIVRDSKGRRTVLIDFGSCSISDSNSLRGSPKYISPELFQISESTKKYPLEVMKRGDIYALGVTMYFLLNGKNPIKADTFQPSKYRSNFISEMGHSDKDFNQIVDRMITNPTQITDFYRLWFRSANSGPSF